MNIKNVMCAACGLTGIVLFLMGLVMAYLSQNFSFVGVGGVLGVVSLGFCFVNISSTH